MSKLAIALDWMRSYFDWFTSQLSPDKVVGLFDSFSTIGQALALLMIVFWRWRHNRGSDGMKQPLKRAAHIEAESYKLLGCPDVKEMINIISSDPDRRHHTESDLLAEWLAKPEVLFGRLSSTKESAQWESLARPLSQLLRRASHPQTISFLQRTLFQAETRAFTASVNEITGLLDRFTNCHPVRRDRLKNRVQLTNSEAVNFRHFVSALSGAVVLVETTAARSRYAERALIWHSREYQGGLRKNSDKQNSMDSHTRYESEHLEGGCSCWNNSERPPGDYDLRNLNLQSVALGEESNSGYLAFVLETNETCYAATEPGGGEMSCKKVNCNLADVSNLGPVFTFTDWGALRQPINGQSQKRTVILTSYVTLFTADDKLVLARRSRKVRNGSGVLSASAGGVLEPGEPGPSGHVDSSGMPDPIVCAIREAKEEIGVDLPYEAVSPVAVFLANIRERKPDSAEKNLYSHLGQIVGVVLSFARVPYDGLSLQQRMNQFADPARGAFEVEKLVLVPLKEEKQKSVSSNLAEYASKNADLLDQHGLLSLVFAAAVVDGSACAAKAFASAFAAHPWWYKGPNEVRVTVDPRSLVSSPDNNLSDAGPNAWKGFWEEFSPASTVTTTT